MTGFTHDGKDYQPKMTRAGVRAAEAQGLAASEIAEKPFTAAPMLMFAALYSAYKLPLHKVESMFDDLIDAGELDFKDTFEELSEDYVGLFSSGESTKGKK